ncbi:ATP-binding protein [Kineococcus sp. SYSU DK003]|uniref:ATP-binding protein n=1 Tax=Kineococcus sp. SYSU DK003 TaxID=3383124 RepID=UPI003D7E863D
MLALAAPHPVAVDDLLSRAWAASAAPSRGALHYQVAALRRLLEPTRSAGSAAQVLQRRGDGYVLDLEPGELDTARVVDLAARAAAAADRPAEAVQLLHTAANLWRGPALADLDDLPTFVLERERLAELRADITEDLVQALLRTGQYEQAVQIARPHTAWHPLRERGWELLVTALCAGGRQAEALSALRTVRTLLADELGLDPGPALRSLEQAVLNQELSLPAGTTQRSTRPVDVSRPVSPILPSALTELVGRQAEVDAVVTTVRQERLTTLTGPGGVGKSRLALAVATALSSRLPVTWVDLTELDPSPKSNLNSELDCNPHSKLDSDSNAELDLWLAPQLDPGIVPATGPEPGAAGEAASEQDLGWNQDPGQNSGQTSGQDSSQDSRQDVDLLCALTATALGVPVAATLGALAAALQGVERVVVLDDCERHLAAVGRLAAHLLRRCPALRLVLTSREVLDVPGEVAVVVSGLEPDQDGADLFVQRAAAVDPRWVPSADDLAVVRRICAEVDGLPLAIELAASRFRVLSLAEIFEALADRFTALRAPRRAADPRARDLLEVVQWSHGALEPVPARTFARCSVFAGAFDLSSAARVAALPTAVTMDALADLVRRSLLSVEAGSTPRRYLMLRTLRAFAATTFCPGERLQATGAHRDWVLEQARLWSQQDRGPGARAALAQLHRAAAEHRVALTGALQDGEYAYAQELAGCLAWAWYRHGRIGEGLSHLRRALRLPQVPERTPVQPRPDDVAAAWFGLGQLSYLAGQVAGGSPGAQAFAAAQRLAAAAGQPALAARAQAWAGHVRTFQDPAAGLVDAVGAVQQARRAGDAAVLGEALMVQGMAMRRNRCPATRTVLAEAVEVAGAAGHRWAVISSSWALVKAAVDEGDLPGAAAVAASLREPLSADGDRTSWLVLVHSAAAVLARAGQAEAAGVLLGAVHHLGAQWGFSPEVMDPIDGPQEAAAVHAAVPAHRWAALTARGAELDRAQVEELLATSLAAVR